MVVLKLVNEVVIDSGAGVITVLVADVVGVVVTVGAPVPQADIGAGLEALDVSEVVTELVAELDALEVPVVVPELVCEQFSDADALDAPVLVTVETMGLDAGLVRDSSWMTCRSCL